MSSTGFQCVKTGADVYLREYGEYVHGDAYMFGDDLVLRICSRGHAKPVSGKIHFTVEKIAQWFDDRHTSESRNSTLLAWVYVDHGYEGIPVNV